MSFGILAILVIVAISSRRAEALLTDAEKQKLLLGRDELPWMILVFFLVAFGQLGMTGPNDYPTWSQPALSAVIFSILAVILVRSIFRFRKAGLPPGFVRSYSVCVSGLLLSLACMLLAWLLTVEVERLKQQMEHLKVEIKQESIDAAKLPQNK